MHTLLFTSSTFTTTIVKMSFPLFFLGFGPKSLTFPTSNVVKAIAIASFAALAAKALLKTVEPSQAGHENQRKFKKTKVCRLGHNSSNEDVDANDLGQTIKKAPLSVESTNDDSNAADIDNIDNNQDVDLAKVATALEDTEATREIVNLEDSDKAAVIAAPISLDEAEVTIITETTPELEQTALHHFRMESTE